MWLIIFYAKIFTNPKLEDALFCIEGKFHIVDTRPPESDVEGAPLSFNNTLSMFLIAAMWLITFYAKIFTNPKLEDALFCIECGFHIVDTNASESDVGRAPNKAPKKSNIDHHPSFSSILSKLFSVVMGLNSNLGNASSFTECRTCVTKVNLLKSDVGRSPHNSPKENTVKHQPLFTDVFLLQLLKTTVWLITKIIYDNLKIEDIASSTECTSGYDNNAVGLTESNVKGLNKPPKKSTIKNHQLSLNQGHTKYLHDSNVNAYSECYKKLTYAVLVGNTVRTCNTKLYASLPLQNKYMVKQRAQDSYGATRIRLVLKLNHERFLSL